MHAYARFVCTRMKIILQLPIIKLQSSIARLGRWLLLVETNEDEDEALSRHENAESQSKCSVRGRGGCNC